MKKYTYEEVCAYVAGVCSMSAFLSVTQLLHFSLAGDTWMVVIAGSSALISLCVAKKPSTLADVVRRWICR